MKQLVEITADRAVIWGSVAVGLLMAFALTSV